MLDFLLRSLRGIYNNMQNTHDRKNYVLILNYDGVAVGNLYGCFSRYFVVNSKTGRVYQGSNTRALYNMAFILQCLCVKQEA